MAYYWGGCNLSKNDINRLKDNKTTGNTSEYKHYNADNFYIYYSENNIKVSNSDSESFLLMNGYIYNPYMSNYSGPKNFSELDKYLRTNDNLNDIYGAFTICFKNKNSVLLARDYPGIFSVYYVLDCDKLYFSNDYNRLRFAGFKNIRYLKPGSSIEYHLKNKNIKQIDHYNPILPTLHNDPIGQFDDMLFNVTKSLFIATSNFDKKVATLLSGGVDSSLITYYLSQICSDVCAFTIDGRDNVFAQEVSNLLNIEHKFIIINDEQWKSGSNIFPRKIYNDGFYELANSLFLPNYFLLQEIKKYPINLAFSGAGSDELFASYSRHLMYMRDISYAARKIVDDCHIYYLETVELASKLSNNPICLMPFFAKEIINFGLALPDKFKIHNSMEKWIVRKVAEKYLPKTTSWREAAPLQYSTNSFKKINGNSYYESYYC
ncbi:MAG: asparagine synthase C-terminal domain-containing protein [Oscillospiraceae bacterium]|jgi:asparagine synthase (glutamine-hydrolysing)|nr:asparagine synthase C-terminal domain-containing protein [Oscillospiraceae bacterium]